VSLTLYIFYNIDLVELGNDPTLNIIVIGFIDNIVYLATREIVEVTTASLTTLAYSV